MMGVVKGSKTLHRILDPLALSPDFLAEVHGVSERFAYPEHKSV